MRLWKEWQWLLIPVLVLGDVAAFIYVMGRVPYAAGIFPSDDAYRYIPMAIQPFTSLNPLAHQPPYTWRILTPLLVHVLPVPTFTGFWIITLLSLIGTVLTLPWLLQSFGLSRPASLGGTLAFVFLGPATAFNLFDYARIDALAFFLLTVALLLSIKRHGFLLFLVLCLLSLDKEVSFFGAAFALIWAWQHRDRRMLVWAGAGLGGSLAVLFLLHTLIPANEPYTLLLQFTSLTQYWVANGTGWQRIQSAFIDTWGFLLPLAAWHVWHPASLWRSWACGLLLLLATLQILVSWDIERVVVYAFPVVIAAVAFSVEDLAERWHRSRWLLWIPLYLLEITWHWGPVYLLALVRWEGVEAVLIAVLTVAALLGPWISKRHHLLPRVLEQ